MARRLLAAVMRLVYLIELPGDPTTPPHFHNRLVMWAVRKEAG